MNITKLYDFTNKTALITGASQGLGKQIAICLSCHGARVILASRNIEKLTELKNNLGNAKAIRLDIADNTSVLKCFNELNSAGEKIDICINNAGVLKPTPIFNLDSTVCFENICNTNILGTWRVLQHVATHMKNNNIHGSIINISSAGADKISRANVSGYYASKAAIVKLTANLVHELSPYNIRINTILPGTYLTKMTQHRFQTNSQIENTTTKIPLKRLGNPKDLDGIILYLSSNNASAYVTGSCFTIDGGMSCLSID